MWKFKAYKITAGTWILTEISLLIKKVFVVGTCLEARNHFLQCSVTGFNNCMPRSSWPTKKQSPCLILFCFLWFFLHLCLTVCSVYVCASILICLFLSLCLQNTLTDRVTEVIFLGLWEVEEYYPNIFHFI